VQTLAVPPQLPLVQTSFDVQALLSSHAVPFGFGVPPLQFPLVGLQVPPLLH
jgi:hypothetical protein